MRHQRLTMDVRGRGGPFLLRLFTRLEHIQPLAFHLRDAARDPDRVLLDRRRQVGERRLRTRDHEHIRETGDAHAHDRRGLHLPFFAQRLAALAADRKGFERAGISLEARRQHNDVEFIIVQRGAHPGLGDLDQRFALLDVDQMHIVAIEGLEIAVIERRALGEQRIVVEARRQQIGERRIVDPLAHLGGDEVARHPVGFGAGEQIVEGFENPAETAGPVFLKDALPFLGRRVDHVAPDGAVERHAEHMIATLGDNRRVIVLDLLFPLGGHLFLHGRQDIIGGALKHRHAARGFRHDRKHLNRGRARADDADLLARIIQPFVRPARGMKDRPFEAVHAGDFRDHRFRNHPHPADKIFAAINVAVAGCDLPAPTRFQIRRLDNFGVELDVRPHVAFVGDEPHVILRLLAARIALRPRPFLQQLGREGEAVIIAFAVGGRARIAVPGPGAADVRCTVEHADIEPFLAQIMDQRQPGKTGTNDDRVIVQGGLVFAIFRGHAGIGVRRRHHTLQ